MKHIPDTSVQTVNICVDSDLVTKQLIKTKIYKIASSLKTFWSKIPHSPGTNFNPSASKQIWRGKKIPTN